MNPLRQKLHALIDELLDAVEEAKPSKDEWLDSKHSPLGATRHRALARAGTLPSVKDGRRVLIKRADIEAYLAKNRRVIKVNPEAEFEAEAQRAATLIQRRSA